MGLTVVREKASNLVDVMDMPVGSVGVVVEGYDARRGHLFYMTEYGRVFDMEGSASWMNLGADGGPLKDVKVELIPSDTELKFTLQYNNKGK